MTRKFFLAMFLTLGIFAMAQHSVLNDTDVELVSIALEDVAENMGVYVAKELTPFASYIGSDIKAFSFLSLGRVIN